MRKKTGCLLKSSPGEIMRRNTLPLLRPTRAVFFLRQAIAERYIDLALDRSANQHGHVYHAHIL